MNLLNPPILNTASYTASKSKIHKLKGKTYNYIKTKNI